MYLFKKYGITLFLLLLVTHCVCIYFEADTARLITKVLLIPVLMTWLRSQTGNHVPLVVYIGLFFSFMGDILLTGSGELFFLLGMLCFIITHICNSIYFVQLRDPRNGRLREAFAAAIVLILLSAVVFAVLNPYLGSFRLPILVYMTIISIMAILAANTAANTGLREVALRFFIPGAALFVASDAILAMNKFLVHQPLLDIVVMATYGGAQYFLVKGFKNAKETLNIEN